MLFVVFDCVSLYFRCWHFCVVDILLLISCSVCLYTLAMTVIHTCRALCVSWFVVVFYVLPIILSGVLCALLFCALCMLCVCTPFSLC